ncbi:MAG: carboxymuconolactone decarboxylase family protein [Thermoleophilaceae bacterium]|nr:carboxymuconolactone decarboxylase family protein [Thermoleophilaceae bacterium]
MKTKESRFQIHDEMTAPERSLPVLKGALSTGGQLSNFLGVLAGAPAALRAYARFRSELRHGSLPWATQQRIAIGVAEHQRSEYAMSLLARTAREAGLGIDEIALARRFQSRDPREAALLRFVQSLVETVDAPPPLHLIEEAREAGWTDEEILEAVAHVALATFGNLVTRAADVPRDGSAEESRLVQAA